MSIPVSNTVFRGIDNVVQPSPLDLPKTLEPKQILLKITHSGLCATDLHVIPHGAALGHEGVGTVVAIGSEVTDFKIGDRAGAGYLRNSCGNCKYCRTGKEVFCAKRDNYGESNFNTGTFADYYIGVESFLFHIPEALSSEDAAPLQCAGATVYSALARNAKPGDRVGIMGIGGLGHLGIQFSKKMGFDTVVFSSGKAKEVEAKNFGADEFYVTGEVENGDVVLKKPVDLLIVAGTAYPDWEKFLNPMILARDGKIVALGVPMEGFKLGGAPMLLNGYTLGTGLVATRQVHIDMLDFAARNEVKPAVETFDLTADGFAKALEKLRAGTMKYRGVLVAQ